MKTLEQLYRVRPEVHPPAVSCLQLAKSRSLGRGVGIEQARRDPSLNICPASGNIKLRDLLEGGVVCVNVTILH